MSYCRFRTHDDDPEWDRLIGYPVYDRVYPGYPVYQPGPRQGTRRATQNDRIEQFFATVEGEFTIRAVVQATGLDHTPVQQAIRTARRRGLIRHVGGGENGPGSHDPYRYVVVRYDAA